jgi:hypothetical protein
MVEGWVECRSGRRTDVTSTRASPGSQDERLSIEVDAAMHVLSEAAPSRLIVHAVSAMAWIGLRSEATTAAPRLTCSATASD